jgi:hypothetical protein
MHFTISFGYLDYQSKQQDLDYQSKQQDLPLDILWYKEWLIGPSKVLPGCFDLFGTQCTSMHTV